MALGANSGPEAFKCLLPVSPLSAMIFLSDFLTLMAVKDFAGSRRLWAARSLAYMEIYNGFTLVNPEEVTLIPTSGVRKYPLSDP